MNVNDTTTPQFEVEKRLQKKGTGNGVDDIEITEHRTQVSETQPQPPKLIKVMLLGKLENPEIKCMR